MPVQSQRLSRFERDQELSKAVGAKLFLHFTSASASVVALTAVDEDRSKRR